MMVLLPSNAVLEEHWIAMGIRLMQDVKDLILMLLREKAIGKMLNPLVNIDSAERVQLELFVHQV